jgi:lipoyl(octanoyl) transferase
MRNILDGIFLGRRPYSPVHSFMMQLHEARRAGHIGDTVLLLEHEPVITLGRGAKAGNLLVSSDELAQRRVDLVETGRGGDVTLHAPGQLIAYPILDLAPHRKDVRKYVQALTRVMKSLVAPYSLDAGTIDEFIGLWIDSESPAHWRGGSVAKMPVKVGAIGVRISRWVTSHGFALNLNTDLSQFELIVPCGIRGRGVTSVEALTGVVPNLEESAQLALKHLSHEFGYEDSRWFDQKDLEWSDVHHPEFKIPGG